MDYEEEVDKVIGKYQMIAMCTYSLDRCNASEIIDVVNNHQFALIKREKEWSLVESTKHKNIAKELEESKKNESFLDILLEDSIQPFGVGYPDGRLGLVNRAFEELTGYTREELKETDWSKILTPPEFQNMETEKLSELVDTGKPVRYEKEYIRKDGTCIPIELLVHLVKNEDGTPKFFYSFITDITQRKLADKEKQQMLESEQQFTEELQTANEELQTTTEELQTSNEQLRDTLEELEKANLELTKQADMIELSYDAIIVWDLNSGIESWNHGAEELYGYTKSEAIGNVTHELLSTIHTIPWPEIKRRLIETGNWEGEVQHRTKQGKYITVSARHQLITRKDGSNIVLEINRDITQRKKAEKIIKQQADLIGLSHDAIIVGEFDGGIESWNNGAEKLYGYTEREVLEKPIHEILNTLSPIPWSQIEAKLLDGGTWEGELTHYTKNGREVIVSSRIQVIKRDDGSMKLLETNRDVTSSKERERFSDALNDINDYINSTLDHDDIMKLIVEKGAKAVGSESSLVNMQEGNKWVVKFAYNFPNNIIGQVKSDQESPTSMYVANEKMAVAFNDAQNDPRVNVDGMKMHGVSSLLVAPIILKEEVIGIIAFYHHTKQVVFSDAQVDFANKLAASLSQAINNAQLFEDIKQSEERYHSLYSSMGEGVAIHEIVYSSDYTPVDYIIKDVNPAFERIVGIKKDEAVDKLASELYGTGNPPYLGIYADVADSGEPTQFEDYFEPMNKTFSISVTSPSRGMFATFFEDISQRKDAEKEIKRNIKVLNGINKIFSESLRCETVEGVINKCLEVAEELTDSEFSFIGKINENYSLDYRTINLHGWEACTANPKGAQELLKDREIVSYWGRTIKEERSQIVNNPESDPDRCVTHEYPPINSFLGVPLKQSGVTIGMIGLANKTGGYTKVDKENIEMLSVAFVEVLMRKRAEIFKQELLEKEQQLTAELKISNEELQSITEELNVSNEELMATQNNLEKMVHKLNISNQELERFAYVASHDLQEPLRMVASFTQLLEKRYKGKLDEDADDYIHFIVEGASRMKDLIDDLLIFSRLNTQGKPFELVNFGKTVNEVLSYLEPSILKSNVEITRETLPTMMGDSSQIRQLFQNLISNAIKFHGDEHPKIHISANEYMDHWKFGVSDNGIGIDPEHQEKIFDVFKRLHTREEYEGTGIGLAICKRIIERHNGEIWVESEPGKGSNFYFTIPK